MSTRFTTLRRFSIVFAVLLAALPWSIHAQPEQRLVVPLSDPGRAATLEVSLVSGQIVVKAYDGNQVVIVVREREGDERARRRGPARVPDEEERARREGLVRIPNTGIGLVAEERDNRVSIGSDGPPRDVELEISVPRRTSVQAKVVNGGDVILEGVTGEHELANVNGEIFARDVAGSVVASTTNGDVDVSFTEVTRNKAMSFTSFNGDVHVAFPANLSADLRIAGGRGDVLTDFDVEIRPQASVVEQGGDGDRYRVRLEREMSVVVGGGGPEIRFKTFNGDITIRKR